MVQPLRRAKVGDIALSSLLLSVFGIVPFALLLADRSRVKTQSLQTAYAICLGISWPTMLLGGIALGWYWRKDRTLDRHFCSTMTTSQLLVVILSMVGVALGGILLLAGEIIELVDVLKDGIEWIVVINIIAILLICWIVQLVMQAALEARDVRRSQLESLEEPPSVDEHKSEPTRPSVM